MNEKEARDAEIKARQDMRLYHKVWRENNKDRLHQYEKERYQKKKKCGKLNPKQTCGCPHRPKKGMRQ